MRCLTENPEVMEVSISQQILTYAGVTYRISSSQYGVGTVEGSNCTPLGDFQISEKYGSGDAVYSLYKGRRWLSVWRADREYTPAPDRVLTRILRLSGLEKENGNTFQRYIYIHGTNVEEGIGTPASIGCLRMKNLDIIALYNQVPLGTKVCIKE